MEIYYSSELNYVSMLIIDAIELIFWIIHKKNHKIKLTSTKQSCII